MLCWRNYKKMGHWLVRANLTASPDGPDEEPEMVYGPYVGRLDTSAGPNVSLGLGLAWLCYPRRPGRSLLRSYRADL